MEPLVAALVLTSAVLHPLWNAMIKRQGRIEGAFFGLFATFCAFGLIHSLIAGYDLFAIFTLWPLMALSWLGQMLYGVGLAAALRRGDLSAYYPIVRSSPLFIVLVGWAVLGETYAPALLVGIAMVLIGAFWLQRKPGKRLLDDPIALLYAVVAMAGTGFYSIADSRLMQVVEAPVLMFWIQVFTLPGYAIVFRYLGGSTGYDHVWGWLRTPWMSLAIGVLCYASYYLILLAFQLGGDVAAVTSVRQASIPISVLLGGLWLKEQGLLTRLGASVLLAVGIVVIVLLR